MFQTPFVGNPEDRFSRDEAQIVPAFKWMNSFYQPLSSVFFLSTNSYGPKKNCKSLTCSKSNELSNG